MPERLEGHLDGGLVLIVAQAVRLYADPGSVVHLSIQRGPENRALLPATTYVSVSGLLIDP